jgi:hypothetical protein
MVCVLKNSFNTAVWCTYFIELNLKISFANILIVCAVFITCFHLSLGAGVAKSLLWICNRLDVRGIVAWLRAKSRDWSSLQSVQTEPKSQPASCSVAPGDPFPRHDTDHSPRFGEKVKSEWRYNSTPPHAFLGPHKDNVPILTKIIFGLDIIMINEYITFNYQGTTVNENYLDVKCAVKDPRTPRSWVGIVKWNK